ncbi:uncharacterized protein LOC119838007 [Zerene cesonia]|uniref:uncharacterized protein LOC119838007 n=1 Tax=Zerene cesonia TaxID=33412 RepID=UPI0018E4F6E2|nr:uncharacterized protein LOC119838007 [Zerene cesonia]
MAKIIKSLFNSTERRKLSRFEEKDEENSIPPQDFRRKLSISRSGRMRQANKKRQSLSLDVYGQDNTDKTKAEIAGSKEKQGKPESKRRHSTDVLNTDEEIDNAFEIIDKS